MLEGKELQGKIGDAGEYSVDVDATGKVVIEGSYDKVISPGLSVKTSDSIELDLILLLRALEPKLNNTLYTGAIEAIAKALGR